MSGDPEGIAHNHGPARGRGLDCPERVIDGIVRGYCVAPELWDPAKDPEGIALVDAIHERKRRQLEGEVEAVRWCAHCYRIHPEGQHTNGPSF